MTQSFGLRRQFQKLGSNGPILEIWPNGNAGFLLFYPGSMLGPGHYFLLLSALFQAGFSIAAIHLIGHGKCAPKFWQCDNFTFDTLLKQGLFAERWLYDNYGRSVAVAGHSQGGILALAHAGESATLAYAFAICAVFPQQDEAIELTRFASLAKHRKQLLELLQNAAKIFPALPLPLPFYLQIGKLVTGKCQPVYMGNEQSRLTYPLGYLVSLFTADINTKLACPIVLYAARNDALFTSRIHEKTFARIEAPQKDLIFLPKGGHMAPLNPYLAQYLARSMASFCAGHSFTINIF